MKLKIKDFFKKVKAFRLLVFLLDRKITKLGREQSWNEELIVYNQNILREADKMKVDALRELDRLSTKIKELANKIADIIKIRGV